jgi:TctA family transporter
VKRRIERNAMKAALIILAAGNVGFAALNVWAWTRSGEWYSLAAAVAALFAAGFFAASAMWSGQTAKGGGTDGQR